MKRFGLRSFKTFDLISYLKPIIFNKKPKPALRPSNGVCAAIIFDCQFTTSAKISLDGILTDSSVYGESLEQSKLHNIYKDVDTFLIKEMCD